MLEVSYDPKVCIHAARCVTERPKVFRVENKQLVIDGHSPHKGSS